ncbi:hypothetical protein Bca101_049311 [Brassica carinata]
MTSRSRGPIEAHGVGAATLPIKSLYSTVNGFLIPPLNSFFQVIDDVGYLGRYLILTTKRFVWEMVRETIS